MADKQEKREVYIEKRVRALTTMLLTRSDNLLIEEVTDDIGQDYIVRFRTPGKEGLREFGIELRGAWTSVTKDHADKVLRLALQQVKRYGPFPRPVCLFFFTMENDDAWYTWVAEPNVSQEGKHVLRLRDAPDCQPLDKRALKEIVDRVDLWYDGFFPSLIGNGQGKSKTVRKQSKR
ncbi:MAG: DUF4365 domain-containing protein [Gemmataceae bacterium]|nr:DUF4365 domain-containing protein [Gemmataceae bacterium]MCI0739105.1 DUF4365 domain-containing protein [Gemmataceae bacterium]